MTASGKPGNPVPDRYLHDADPLREAGLRYRYLMGTGIRGPVDL